MRIKFVVVHVVEAEIWKSRKFWKMRSSTTRWQISTKSWQTLSLCFGATKKTNRYFQKKKNSNQTVLSSQIMFRKSEHIVLLINIKLNHYVIEGKGVRPSNKTLFLQLSWLVPRKLMISVCFQQYAIEYNKLFLWCWCLFLASN